VKDQSYKAEPPKEYKQGIFNQPIKDRFQQVTTMAEEIKIRSNYLINERKVISMYTNYVK
jgi:hypothetical protein